jgi:micrococcal nuclease
MQEIAKTGTVILYFDESQGMYDGYGRLLAYVELPETKTDLGKQMLLDGYAREFTYNKKYEKQDEYKKAENEARQNERGLWKSGVCD